MHSNRLIHEKSPYLQQHAHNPVDWYPWGPEAFEKSRAEDKPIFLSIGYSTCHWCHVMEKESFENEEIAAQVNKWFVPVKIDREERPDIDKIYMSYVQATTGSGGWPMSVWLTPDLKPIVGGTYFPPENRYGRAGFPIVLERVAQAWQNDREQILKSSVAVMEHLSLQAVGSAEPGEGTVSAAVLESAFQQFRRAFDSRLGGFGSAPKFPRPSVYNFLLRYWKRTGNDEALDMVAETLLAMERGGMHDQLGGGFHRYSVDEYWFVPHFEKMLYDQAQLAVSYLETFQITGNHTLALAAARILDYVMRDMTDAGGGFYSAEDADSAPDPSQPREKSEGAFYVWASGEIETLLGAEKAAWIRYRYGMEEHGNVQHDPHQEFAGRNIFFQAHTLEETAARFGLNAETLVTGITEAERVLFEARELRARPHLDNKILTAWNGLMISAFAKGGAILNEPKYTGAARQAADFLLGSLRLPDGALLRRYCDGEAAIAGMLDDYAFFVQGLMDLYEATFDFRYLREAVSLSERQAALLEDEAGGFFTSSQEDAARLMKTKDDYDGAEPSGNAVALNNLLRLARITGHSRFEESARRLIGVFGKGMSQAPTGMPQMLAAIEFDIAPRREIVVAGETVGDMVQEIWKSFDPGRVLLYAAPQIAEWLPATREMHPPPGGTAVYLCENFTCRKPAMNREELSGLLR